MFDISDHVAGNLFVLAQFVLLIACVVFVVRGSGED